MGLWAIRAFTSLFLINFSVEGKENFHEVTGVMSFQELKDSVNYESNECTDKMFNGC